MSLFSPNDAPMFTLARGVHIMELDKEEKRMGLIVHVTCWEHELQNPDIKNQVRASVKWGIEYLIAEGFISNVKGWSVTVSVTGHPPEQ